MRVTVNVTDQNIKHGIRGNCCWCPIALGIRDAIPGCVDVEMIPSSVAVRVNDRSFRATPPTAAIKFMLRFDNRESVEPISFPLTFEPADPTA